jgi:hypothetical protein
VNISLYGIARGKLRVLHFFPERYEDKLPLFGTVGTGDSNARCRMGGPLIFLSQSPTSMTGKRWRFDRTDYRLSEHRLSATRRRSVVVSYEKAPTLSKRWDFDVEPFSGCAVARGRRL